MNSLRFQNLVMGAVTKKDQRVGPKTVPIRIFSLTCDVLPDYKYKNLLADLKERLLLKQSIVDAEGSVTNETETVTNKMFDAELQSNKLENVNSNSLNLQPLKAQ